MTNLNCAEVISGFCVLGLLLLLKYYYYYYYYYY